MPYKDKVVRDEYNKDYYKSKQVGILEQKKEYFTKNRESISKKQSEYRKTPKGRFAHTRCAKYMTFEEYTELKSSQNDLCAICGSKCSSGKHLAIDHDHVTNRIRGLLCMNCNFGLGKFKDDITLLEKAIAYLKK